MKRSKSTIPLAMRREMAESPDYQFCSLLGQGGHQCEGRITWEHAIVYGNKKVQEIWAIIPLCEKGHAVNSFQDAGTMRKEVNIWVALNRATDEELASVSKAIDYIRMKEYLNEKYGPYIRHIPSHISSYLPESSDIAY